MACLSLTRTDGEIAGAMVGSAVENKKHVLPGKLARGHQETPRSMPYSMSA
jgi:hypothetical protein